MLETTTQVHANPYFRYSEEAVLAYKDSLVASWDSSYVPARVFIVSAMKMIALMSNGHAQVYWMSKAIKEELKAHEYMPFLVELDAVNEVKVTTSSKKSSELIGKTITAINGVPIQELTDEMLTYVGGEPHFKREQVGELFPVYCFLDGRLKAPYTVKTASGETITVKGVGVAGVNDLGQQKNNAEKAYTFEVVDGDIGLIAYNQCLFLDQFPPFLEKTFAELEAKGIDKLIIDIRNNPGGDSRLNDSLLSYITTTPYRQMTGRYWKVSDQVKDKIERNGFWEEFLPDSFLTAYKTAPAGSFIEEFDSTMVEPLPVANKFQGKVCVLIGPSTFSSANMLADAVKSYGLATLIGQPSGELTNDYGEMVSFYFKQTETALFVPSTYDIGASGNTEEHSVVLPDIYSDDAMKDAKNWLRKR